MLISLSLCVWSACRFGFAAHASTLVTDDGSAVNGSLNAIHDVMALTDRGNEIPLYQGHIDERIEVPKSAENQPDHKYADVAILRQARNVQANCHGWVFCADRYVVMGKDVDTILTDNQYTIVKTPLPGDLAIYRDLQGTVLHSALVRGVLDDGTVMVESKWGIDRRFLHSVVDQPYSQRYEYYRSPRRGHQLTFLNRPAPDMQLSPEDRDAIHQMLSGVLPQQLQPNSSPPSSQAPPHS